MHVSVGAPRPGALSHTPTPTQGEHPEQQQQRRRQRLQHKRQRGRGQGELWCLPDPAHQRWVVLVHDLLGHSADQLGVHVLGKGQPLRVGWGLVWGGWHIAAGAGKEATSRPQPPSHTIQARHGLAAAQGRATAFPASCCPCLRQRAEGRQVQRVLA